MINLQKQQQFTLQFTLYPSCERTMTGELMIRHLHARKNEQPRIVDHCWDFGHTFSVMGSTTAMKLPVLECSWNCILRNVNCLFFTRTWQNVLRRCPWLTRIWSPIEHAKRLNAFWIILRHIVVSTSSWFNIWGTVGDPQSHLHSIDKIEPGKQWKPTTVIRGHRQSIKLR